MLQWLPASALAGSERLMLEKGWRLHYRADSLIPVKVPGIVHTQLLEAGLIDDPFLGLNEGKLQWIGKRIWSYSLDFELGQQMFSHRHLSLVCEGLDTYAHLWLNGQKVLEADNMFRRWVLDVKSNLKPGRNRLEVIFFPPDSISRSKAQNYPMQLPDVRAFTRKAPFQAGWDWGPIYQTMGIWKPIYIEAHDGTKLRDAAVLTLEANAQIAQLALLATLDSDSSGIGKAVLRTKGRIILKRQFEIRPGINDLFLPFGITNPMLWWPNGYGDQHLYRFDLEVSTSDKTVHSKTLVSGIRQAELVSQADSIGVGFVIRINGKKIFSKGTNYIPEDHFVTRITRERHRQLLSDAAAVGMNMIRVWGGGVYPSDDFYEICDSLGLMVWQDFMFACTMYPWDEAFRQNVKQEAIEVISRLRKFASLVLWCGNNEVWEGFHHWGWQNSLGWSADDSAHTWQGYLSLFEHILPEAVSTYDPTKSYWPSSPSGGWGSEGSFKRGDVHYWGVWWGEEPFETYLQKVGRFHSEYGFQAMPAAESIFEFLPENEWFVGSAGLEAHQKHPRGSQLIDHYMANDFPVPVELDDYVYMSQLLQAYGIEMAIGAHRKNQPITMGTLYWQLNDSWPAVSWSSIDYFGRWKALHYRLKHLYANTAIFFSGDKTKTEVYVVHDGPEEINGTLIVEVFELSGALVQSSTRELLLKPHNVLKAKLIEWDILPAPPQALSIHCRFVCKHSTIAENAYFHAKPKALWLSSQSPEIVVVAKDEFVELHISAQVVHYGLQLFSNDVNGRFSDNFFHLAPGQVKIVRFSKSGKVPQSELHFGYRSLNQFLAPLPYKR